MAKRLVIARALAMHQDGQQSDSAMTTIIITHDKDLLNRLERRTVMLHEGRVYFDGSFEDFEAPTRRSFAPISLPCQPCADARPISINAGVDYDGQCLTFPWKPKPPRRELCASPASTKPGAGPGPGRWSRRR
jgi:energy-coupling factor transporter ATP-binding protein EcfA2